MKLSQNFELSELIKSQTATRLGIPNQPNSKQIANLQLLTQKILQPVRDHFGRPVVISSGYRSPLLNSRVSSSKLSQHCYGQAADFEIPGVSNEAIALWIRENLVYDQLILEFHNPKDPSSGWVHCSYVNHNRLETFIFDGKVYRPWVN
jgi:zinc D-Ala-D-Ala carboxypeptidase